MKKTTIIIGAILASLSITPAYAEEVKTLAIVDSYFDTSKLSGNIENICVASTGCELKPTYSSKSFSDPLNHGTAMAELAIKQNPKIKLVLIRAASQTKNARTGAVSIGLISGNDFLKSLQLVSSRKDIKAVSFSYNLSGNRECSLSNSGGVNVRVVDPQIRSTIILLKNNGVPVFSSTGNRAGAPVNYPACITEVNSVSVGDLNNKGSIASVFTFDSNTDYFVTGSVFNYNSIAFGLIPNTTSAGNVAVAAKYVGGLLDNKFVNVIP
jgi:hypothetical protein